MPPSAENVLSVGVAVVGGAAVLLWMKKKLSSSSSADNNTSRGPGDKLCLYGNLDGFGPDPDVSPPCAKLKTFLKMTDTDFDFVPLSEHQYQNAPRGKIPWVTGGIFETAKGDSTLIMEALVRSDPAKYDIDKHLSQEEKAVGTAFKIMIEESIYWSVVHIRWTGNSNAEYHRDSVPVYFRGLAFPSSYIFPRVARKIVSRNIYGQGVGRLTESEIYLKLEKEIKAISEFLGLKKYLFGDRVSSFDATVYAYLACFLRPEWKHDLCDMVCEYTNLVDYVMRMRQEFWPELQK